MELTVKIEQSLNDRRLSEARGGVKGIASHTDLFERISSLDNLVGAWYEFRRGKRQKADVQAFELRLEDQLFSLHRQLNIGEYHPDPYHHFRITDPKPRRISKPSVRDRLLHQAIYRVLYPLYDQTFIFDSYSCRKGKGTHAAFARLVQLCRKVSRNYTQPCWALKWDIRKFFDSISHDRLLELLKRSLDDTRLLRLLEQTIRSFEISPGRGLPLGNLTSQLFVNIYLDPLDKFVVHHLKAPQYLRYADDCLLIGSNPSELIGMLIEVNRFLRSQLSLALHPQKISLCKLYWGIDFVGYVALPHYELPRRRTIERIFRRAERLALEDPDRLAATLPSYLGYLKHVYGYGWQQRLPSQVRLDDWEFCG